MLKRYLITNDGAPGARKLSDCSSRVLEYIHRTIPELFFSSSMVLGINLESIFGQAHQGYFIRMTSHDWLVQDCATPEPH